MTSAILNAVVSSPQTASASPSDISAKAHHNKHGKGFVNPWPSYEDFTPWKIVLKMLRMRFTGQWNNPDTTPPTVPVRKPELLPTRQTDKLRATWLGHACYYVEFPGGLRVLFDPVFEARCSPFSFMGPKRYTEMPCEIEDLPFIDAVVISHSHYDHLSHPTIKKISQKYPECHFFVGLGNKEWFTNMGISEKKVTELDWWDERTITLSAPPSEIGSVASSNVSEAPDKSQNITATIGCLPCQHTSARTPFDKGHTLWASWSVSSGGKKVWFGGDTGYRKVPELPKDEFDYSEKYSHLPHCPAFKQIGELRGPFDLGLIPIGAYDPRFIMSPMHANPYDSVNIFADTKCERALGIHWGTWVLTTEEVLEPPRKLKEALKWKGMPEEASMAPMKERSKASNGKSNGDAAVLKRTGEAKKISKCPFKTAASKGKDLLATLPAELRNEIYKLALIEEKVFVIGSVEKYRDPLNRQNHAPIDDLSQVANARVARKKSTSHANRINPWVEPALLQVSRKIRDEASKMYYGSNSFIARTKLVDFAKLGAWLETLCRRCGRQPLHAFRISVIDVTWLGLYNAVDLCKAVATSGIELKPLTSPLWRSTRARMLGVDPLVQLNRRWHYSIERPLNEALSIVRIAKAGHRTEEWIARKLVWWLREKYSRYDALKSLGKMGIDPFLGGKFVGMDILKQMDHNRAVVWKKSATKRSSEGGKAGECLARV
ncbi:Zn-dependent hydrolase/oxidoreductase [Hortaea werneckii]|nr:Zn-dependent hydrolase/oxidoreductase [Hortaea werneckii]KAI7104639.1 Zn-dependent hydrolase/oxidoreductase [Hortaea werneckii]KAI7219717.1 Zn-dependent hydrolase/oxidoreductase [Hortaea werneckii]KAI7335727.1 Zn-dependent hydrolase/oxidoreductase [Hortaea werneckii]KAI7389662.1 Zn-dependent hydrolase/oxidoreductase [Hortaea werneckii]